MASAGGLGGAGRIYRSNGEGRWDLGAGRIHGSNRGIGYRQHQQEGSRGLRVQAASVGEIRGRWDLQEQLWGRQNPQRVAGVQEALVGSGGLVESSEGLRDPQPLPPNEPTLPSLLPFSLILASFTPSTCKH